MLQTAFAGDIIGIDVSALPSNQRLVKVRFDKDVVNPTGFVTAIPSRIALDFVDTGVNLKQPNLTFDDSLLKQIIAAQSDGHSRLLFALSKEGQYSAQIKGNEVWIYISEAVNTNTAPVVAKTEVVKPNAQQPTFSSDLNIDFRKGKDNSGIVEYASKYTGTPDIKTQSDRIVITLKNYPIPVSDQRNLDVTDFSTPVRSIIVKRIGNDTQLTILNQGAWEHKVTQQGDKQLIEIAKRNEVTTVDNKKPTFKGKNISLDFQNIDVRTILQILAKESGLNIIASSEVQGSMTISLKDVPWDQALDLVLDANNLDMQREGNIINVTTREKRLRDTRNDLERTREIESLGTLYSRTFQLKYKNVEEFKEILKLSDGGTNDSRSILSSRGSALIDPSTNTLIINDIQSVINKFEKLIEELDVPARQVMVEVRIVEASEGVSRELGVKFGFSRRNRATSWGNSLDTAITNNERGADTTGLLGANVNVPISSTATGAVSVVHATASAALGLELTAMETDNRSKTISTPRVVTQDGQEAEIKQGFQIPYTTRDGDTTTTAFKDAVMRLQIKPRITPDNKVILDVEVNKDSPDRTYTNILGEPGISTKSVKTQAMIEDGATLVVGGVYQEEYSNTVSKVPVLGDIPVLGNLFKSRSRKNSRNELLFFITPRIIGQESSVLRY